MVVMKTADSGFEGYIKDDLTTLKETSDRLFCTAVTAEWRYSVDTLDFDAMRAALREAMMKTFAEHKSKSVQETLYEMGKSGAGACGGGRPDRYDDAEQALPAGRSFALRAGQSE